MIVNALPAIDLSGPPKVGVDKRAVVQGTVSQSLVGVVAVQVRIDGGEWIAATPQDGLFDGPREGFTYISKELASGKHTVEVEAFNAAGQKNVNKSEILVP